jgi:prepilin-type N-terminal cleavage/methylation domain-containing protein
MKRYPILKRRLSTRGFTLIELLMVLAVIAILIVITFPLVANIQTRALITSASADCRSIALAWRFYYADRGQWPNQQEFEPEGSTAKSTEAADGEVFWSAYVKLLTGNFDPSEEAFIRHNPGQLPFLNIGPDRIDANGEFVDPWGNPYKFKLDKQYSVNNDGAFVDGILTDDHRIGRFAYNEWGDPDNPRPGQIIIHDIVIAWSRGPNGMDHNPDVARGDPKSW